MYFDLTPQQWGLRDEVRMALADAGGPAAFRQLLEASAGADSSGPFDQRGERSRSAIQSAESTWAVMRKAGWVGIAIPREYGGGGLGPVEMGVVAQECGRALAPVPLTASSAVAVAIHRWGTEDQRRRYLPELASGELVGLLAFWGPEGVLRVRADAASLGEDCFFSGATLVLGGPVFDRAVVLVVASGEERHAPSPAVLVEVGADSKALAALASIDGDWSQSVLTVESAEAAYLGNESADSEASDRAVDILAVLTACEQLGAAERCLELAVEYAKRRFAFGQPIGSFQALRHKLADMYAGVEFARSNAYFALWALEHGWDEIPVAACQARIAAGDALRSAAEESVHVHGAYGYTWDADPQLYLRKAQGLESGLGGAVRWRELLMRRLLASRRQGAVERRGAEYGLR